MKVKDSHLRTCAICGKKAEDTATVEIFAADNKGIDACFECRLAISEVLEAVMRLGARTRKQAWGEAIFGSEEAT
jgi:hypothetical protein